MRLPCRRHPLQALVSELLRAGARHRRDVERGARLRQPGAQGRARDGRRDRRLNSYAQRGSFAVIEHQLAAAIELFPIFARRALLRTWAGIVDVSPDASPIVGPTPVNGLFVNCGWGTGGFKATPGSGWAFAERSRTATARARRAVPLDRFTTGALIDEHGAAGVAH